MKKNLLIIGLISISILLAPQITYGDSSSCLIETEPAQALTDYIKNVRKAVTNTNKSLLNNIDKKDTGQLSLAGNDIARIYNEMINWDGFYTDFKYYLTFPMLNDIPAPIQRDLTMLENETEGLRSYLKTLVNKGYSGVSLKKEEVCSGINNCSLQGDPKNIIGDIIKNNTQVTTLYKQIVTNPKQNFSLNIILSNENSENFIEQLKKNYGNDTIEACSNTEDGFSTRIKEAKESILLNNQQGKDGIKKWRDAWKLLVGSSDDKDYAKLEKSLLEKELSRQGLSTSAQKIMMENLKEFNQNNFYTLDNNFLVNSVAQIYDAGVKIKDGFNEAKKDLFSSEDTGQINQEASVGINKLLNSSEKVNITENIKKRIDILNRSHLEYASIESYSTKKIQADIIKMHNKIKHSSQTLRATCELAVKVCNDQGRGKGNCGSCK